MTTTGSPTPPQAPPYGERTLSDLLPAVLRALNEGDPAPSALNLTPARRGCVLLVDGLGLRQLEQGAEMAPCLSALLEASRSPTALTAGFPATTATSLTSLGTGSTPGQHGMVGYTIFIPGTGRILNTLRWDNGVDPLTWQPLATCFERAESAGLPVVRIGPGAFAGSGLTRAALRGGGYLPAETPGERVAAALDALTRERTLVYVYYSDLDTTGHLAGVGSLAWRLQLQHVDRLVEQLVERLPPRTALWITGDHGMIDVPMDRRFDLATETDLAVGVERLAGEARVRHVHALPGAAADIQDSWRGVLGDSTWVLSRDEAIALGWFGPVVTDRARARIGDVVAAASAPVAIVDSARERPELLRLVGMHGSRSEEEAVVPLIEHVSG